MSGSASSSDRNPARTMPWSSTMTTRVIAGRVLRRGRRASQPGAAAGRGPSRRPCRRRGRRARGCRPGRGRRRRCRRAGRGRRPRPRPRASCRVVAPAQRRPGARHRSAAARWSAPPGRSGTPPGRARAAAATGSPSTVSRTRQVAGAGRVDQAVRARPARAAGPARPTRRRARSTPNSRRISASASRAVASTAARSAASRAWSGPSRRRTACVWMVTTLIEWDTMSCSSRAIRVRSSAAMPRGLLLPLALEPVGAGDGLLGAGGAVAA